MPDPLVESKVNESAHASAISKEADLNAHEAMMEAAFDRSFKKAFTLDDGVTRRFVDVSRANLICQSLVGIDKKLENIDSNMVNQDQFWPVKTLVYGLTGLMLSGMIISILALVIR